MPSYLERLTQAARSYAGGDEAAKRRGQWVDQKFAAAKAVSDKFNSSNYGRGLRKAGSYIGLSQDPEYQDLKQRLEEVDRQIYQAQNAQSDREKILGSANVEPVPAIEKAP